LAEILAGSRTSYHEAGHAVTARALGYAVTDIQFAPRNPAFEAYVQHGVTRSGTLDNAIIGMAGASAVMIKFGTEYGSLSGPDAASLENLSSDERNAAIRRSLELLQENWAEVEQLAHELYPAHPA
jgi:hypothetical protein